MSLNGAVSVDAAVHSPLFIPAHLKQRQNTFSVGVDDAIYSPLLLLAQSKEHSFHQQSNPYGVLAYTLARPESVLGRHSI